MQNTSDVPKGQPKFNPNTFNPNTSSLPEQVAAVEAVTAQLKAKGLPSSRRLSFRAQQLKAQLPPFLLDKAKKVSKKSAPATPEVLAAKFEADEKFRAALLLWAADAALIALGHKDD